MQDSSVKAIHEWIQTFDKYNVYTLVAAVNRMNIHSVHGWTVAHVVKAWKNYRKPHASCKKGFRVVKKKS